MPDHRWAAGVTFQHVGQTFVAQHMAMPFGASSAVHAWDRIAKLILKIARTLLRLPVLAYVDDFLGAEWAQSAPHALEALSFFFRCCVSGAQLLPQVFARLVRAVLGESALQQKKMDCGASIEVLGLICRVEVEGVFCKPSPNKAGSFVSASSGPWPPLCFTGAEVVPHHG